MKTKIKAIITIIIIIIGLWIYSGIKDQHRANYAQTNNCTWVIYGSHDICK